MTVMQAVLVYLLECHPELLAYLRVDETHYIDPQKGYQN